MKFAAAYYLLLIYLTVIFQPLIPIAEDELFHCFAEAYHVATVHAKYGNNHVETALANDGKENDSNKNQASAKYDELTLVHISAKQPVIDCFIKNQAEKIYCFTTDKLPGIFLSKPIPPPKFLI